MSNPHASGREIADRVLAAASDAFISIDTSSVIRDWNPAAERIFGWSAEEAIGRNLAETLIPEDLREAHHAGMARFLETAVPRVMGQRLELTALHRDGRVLPIEITIWPAEDSDEVYFRAFIHDISERVRRARYVEAHNGVSQALSPAHDLDQGLVAALRAIGQPLGWDVGAYWHLDRGDETLRAKVLWRRGDGDGGEFERITRELRPRRGPGTIPGRVLEHDGLQWIDDMGATDLPRAEAAYRAGLATAIGLPVRDRHGVCGVVEFFAHDRIEHDAELIDVLEAAAATIGQFVQRRLGEADLARAHATALEASRLKSEFLANTSHEIRTPLNGVIGMADLLLRTELGQEQRDYAATLFTSAQALLAVINDILDLSKIEAGKLELDDSDFALHDVVEGAVVTFAEQVHRKEVELVSWIEPSLPEAVRGDAGRLRQVLVNLISNAVKFTEEGEIVVRAGLVREDADGVTLRFEVRDTGIGLDDADAGRLFESFAQADSSTTRRYGGTGLGLAISRQLVELMGGRIGVETALGAGSTFWFEARLRRGRTEVAAAPEAGELGGLRALVVDDNETNRFLVRAQLGAWGMRCDVAEGADQAIALLERAVADGEPHDVALLDYHMPEVDGLELSRRIRAAPRLRHTRLILLTSGIADASVARSAGIAAHLTKPVRQARLREAVVGVLAGPTTAPVPVPEPVADGVGAASHALVLVAEDHPVNQLVVRKLLEQEGLEVDVASDGAEAVAMVAERSYAAVFMDCQMPVLDGYEATGQLREAGHIALPVIALTAHAMKGDRERCMSAGMDDYLAKPIDPSELQRVLATWVAPARERAEATAAAAAEFAQADNTLDLAVIDRLRSDFDLATRRQLLDLFLDQAPRSLMRLREEAGEARVEGVRVEAHRLKGSCLNLGAEAMRRLCADVESRTAAGELRLGTLLDELEDAFARTRTVLPPRLAA